MKVHSVAFIAWLAVSSSTAPAVEGFVMPKSRATLTATTKTTTTLQMRRSAMDILFDINASFKQGLKFLLVPQAKNKPTYPTYTGQASSSSAMSSTTTYSPAAEITTPVQDVVVAPVVPQALPQAVASSNSADTVKAMMDELTAKLEQNVKLDFVPTTTGTVTPPDDVIKAAVQALRESYQARMAMIHDAPRSPGGAPTLAEYLQQHDWDVASLQAALSQATDAPLEKITAAVSQLSTQLQEQQQAMQFQVRSMEMPQFQGVEMPKFQSIEIPKFQLPSMDLEFKAVDMPSFPADAFWASVEEMKALLVSSSAEFQLANLVKAAKLDELGPWYAGGAGLLLLVLMAVSSSSVPSTSTAETTKTAKSTKAIKVPTVPRRSVATAGTAAAQFSSDFTGPQLHLQEQVNQLALLTRAVKEELEKLKSEKSTRDAEMSDLQGEVRALRAQMEEGRRIEAVLRQDLQIAQQTVLDQADVLRQMQAEKIKMRSEMAKLTAKAESLERQLQEATSGAAFMFRESKAQQQLKQAKAAVTSQKTLIDALQNKQDRMRTEMNNLIQEREMMQSEMNKLVLERELMKNEMDKMVSQVVQVKNQLDAAARFALSDIQLDAPNQVRMSNVQNGRPMFPGFAATIVRPSTAATAATVYGVAPRNEWSDMPEAELRKKSIRELQRYLVDKGMRITDRDGKPLGKTALVEAVQGAVAV